MDMKEPMTLDQIGEELVKAARKLRNHAPTGKRKTQEELNAETAKSHAEMMKLLKQPVGSLKSK